MRTPLLAIVLVVGAAVAAGHAQSNARTVAEDVQPPRVIKRIEPTYPSIARAARVQGRVEIDASIAVTGKVLDATVVTSPSPLLADAALAAVRQWEYEPARYRGNPVPMRMSIDVEFRLAGGISESTTAAGAATSIAAPQSQSEGLAVPILSPGLDRKTVLDRLGSPTATGDGTEVDAGALVYDLEEFGRLYVYFAGDRVSFWFPGDYPLARVKQAARSAHAQPVSLGASQVTPSSPMMSRSAEGTNPGSSRIAPTWPIPSISNSSEPNIRNAPYVPGSATAAPPCPTPSYDVTPLRWEAFPILVYIEEPELTRRGYSPERTRQIVQLIMKGLGSWADATGQRVGAIQRVTDYSKSQLNVVFRNGTGNTIHGRVQGDFIRHATIMMDIMKNESFGAPFVQTYEGRSFTDGADHRTVYTAAHEMGHVLGIVRHPESSGSLMVDSPEQMFYEGPQPIDVNAIMKKYGACGQPSSLAPINRDPQAPQPVVQRRAPATAAPPPPPSTASVSFAGRWQCTVHGSEALMNQFSFTVNDDGTVFLAGLAEEPRAAITSTSIQFESRGGGTVDATSLRGNSSRLDGTRTLTIPGTPTVSHRISCVPSQRR